MAASILTARWLARAPIGLFRAGLGFLFGGTACNPDCHISIGARRRVPVLATVLGGAEAKEISYQSLG